MRILHLISGGDVGGAKTHVHTLLAGLKETEKVLLVCFQQGPFAQEAQELGIPTRVMTGSIPLVLRRLKQLIHDEGFEIIHCHGARANLIGSILKNHTKIPTISTVHSDPRLDYMGRPLAALTFGNLNQIALRRMDFWIGVSQPMVDMLHTRGADPNRSFAISNGVSFQHAPPALDRASYLRSVGIEDTPDMTVFGIAARINPVKDMGTLIRAFAKTVAACPSARLIIAGDGEQRAQMEALAAELCPPDTVRFAGWVTDTHSFYSAIDVNMLTSLSEGFPYALPEGASWHCATIASRVGGIPSLVEHEVNGLLFTPRDVDTLANYMIRLARDRKLLNSYADRLYADARKKYSIEATVARQKEIYDAVLRRTARAAARKRDGVLICGAFGKGNIGDDAILQAMVQEMRRLDPDLPLYATTRSPGRTAREAKVGTVYTFHPWKLRQRLKKTLLFLSGGGSLIQDATSTRSLLYYLHAIRLAKRKGNQVMMFSCGIGPVQRTINQRRAANTIQSCVDRITLRDSASAHVLERLGVHGIPTRVTADLAFLVQPAPQDRVEKLCIEGCVEGAVAPGDRLLLLAPRPWEGAEDYLEAFAGAAAYAARNYGLKPVLLAMEPKKDLSICKQIAQIALKQSGVSCSVLAASEDAAAVVGLIRRADAVLGMRLHALIFASSQGTPFAGVSYDPKVEGFLDYIGQDCWCSLKDADTERLCAMVDAILPVSRESILAASQRLRPLAAENCEEVLQMIRA
ncbi:MAG: polysaccharide pyruvyl transferase CsaB [Oscillospiraceae bacterium]|nr:polysaccharide pyruvyl transferase CsaB [Oscillospiraceae bacterium]